MTVQCEAQLRAKAEAFVKILQNANVPVQIEDVVYHDFNAMLRLADGKGNLHIYYSPRNRAYKLGLHQFKDPALKPIIEQHWLTITPQKSLPPPSDAPQLRYQAYVDGSFQDGVVGYGLVILRDGVKIYQDAGVVERYTDQRQVTGELGAAMRVIRWCEEQQIRHIQIFYDYNGIEKWATGAWRARTEATQAYQDYMRQTQVKVVWQKVKSHSGDQWNDVVDQLAKQGAQAGASAGGDGANPLLIELEKIALEFVAYLDQHAVPAEFVQIYNGMFARLKIKTGLFDLYHTAKKPLSPRLSNFQDPALQARVLTLWGQFKNTAG